MELAFGVSAYSRERGNLPELPVVNMVLEKSATEPKQIALLSRPGLEDNAVNSGAGPIKGIFQKDGVLDGDLLTVTTSIYRDGALQGAITGTGHVSVAGNEIGAIFNAGADIHYHDGSALALADFPDAADVCKVLEIAGRFIAIRSGTQKFYWTDTLESALVLGVLTFGGLAFASAENEPDQLLDACVVDDKLILGGTETIEWWAKTGDDELPFSPIEGLVYEKGVRATGCLVAFDNSFAFVSNENLVYRGGNVPMRISDSGIEERIADSASCALFTAFWEGHELLFVRLDAETLVYDAQTKAWSEWATSGETNFIGRCACPGPIFGSALDGKTLVFGDEFNDLGDPLERRFRAGLALTGGTVVANRLTLRTNPGTTQDVAGDPVVEVRFSRDGGNTWTEYKPARKGSQGDYGRSVEWRALGMFNSPGMLAEFRMTDDDDFRVSGVYINEPGGGRARA